MIVPVPVQKIMQVLNGKSSSKSGTAEYDDSQHPIKARQNIHLWARASFCVEVIGSYIPMIKLMFWTMTRFWYLYTAHGHAGTPFILLPLDVRIEDRKHQIL